MNAAVSTPASAKATTASTYPSDRHKKGLGRPYFWLLLNNELTTLIRSMPTPIR
jgi:hypothetical protein